MNISQNPHRGSGLPVDGAGEALAISTDVAAVSELLARCPKAVATPLLTVPELARRCGIGELWVKDERERMGLGSFKALGASYVIARAAAAAAAAAAGDIHTALAGATYVTASAGNHGLSVAAGARVFGAAAVVFLATTVPEAFAERLRHHGARVVRAGDTYEASMAAAAHAAAANHWVLISDSSWPGYTEIPARIMEGYLVMAAEAAERLDQIAGPPSHLVLQAGVGGMAAAVAAHARKRWGQTPLIVVVEPEAAAALMGSVQAGRAVRADGPVSCMGRLDCKEPSVLALAALARDADAFVTITEAEATKALPVLADHGLETTASGGAGLAALLALGPERTALRLALDSRVLAFLSEGPEVGTQP